MQRVPVISPDGHPLMPTKPSRARRWLKEGKAKIYPNDLNIFAIQLIGEPSGYKTQDVVIGIDPGKLFSGVGVQTSKATLFKLHLILPFPKVTKKMTARRILRRARRGGNWEGDVFITSALFKVIAKPNIYRRQLHFENPDSHKPNPTQYRKRKGGTITPFGFRSGDFVQAEKAGQIYRGWIGGYTETAKSKNVSIYNHEWKRIGQFTPSKVKLLKRSTKLCIA